jgi:hypothetical protein
MLKPRLAGTPTTLGAAPIVGEDIEMTSLDPLALTNEHAAPNAAVLIPSTPNV